MNDTFWKSSKYVKKKNVAFPHWKCVICILLSNIAIEMDIWHSVTEADDDNKNNKNHISVLFMTYCWVILFQWYIVYYYFITSHRIPRTNDKCAVQSKSKSPVWNRSIWNNRRVRLVVILITHLGQTVILPLYCQ